MTHPAATLFARGARIRSEWARVGLAVVGALGLSTAASAATFTVNVGQGGGTVFVDQTSGSSTTTIHVGDTVQWVWVSGTHSSTSGTCTGGGYYGGCTSDGNWDSGVNSPPHMFSKTFSQTGTFNYYCTIHQSMMTGMVVVQAATGNPPTAGFRFSPTGPVVGTTVHFTDTSTGSPTSWSWNFGDPASASNTSASQNPTHAFSAAGTYTVTESATNAGGSNTASNTITVAAGGATTCTPDTSTMCLNSNRFQVTAVWQKTDGTSGSGTAVPLTADSGYFWFFDPTNIELVTKALNACSVNNDYWVFAAGLTNVQVTLKVVDTSNGVSETYVNPQGTAFAPIQDTAAFPTCP
jgi:PKD repeat protein